jgi:uncharacterized protein DUF2568
MYEIWRWGNLGLAFLVELLGLAVFAWWGWNASGGTVLRLVLAIGLPVIAAVVWGLLAAPTASHTNPVVRAVVKVVFFGLAGLALWTHDHYVLAVVFVVVVAAKLAVIRVSHLSAAPTPG